MTTPPAARAFEVRHVQIARALFAAIAAVMVTFSSDHSAAVGLAVFSGFAIATALVLALSVWLVHPAGQRTTPAVLAAVTGAAGLISGVGAWRSTEFYFALVISWALVSGVVELVGGLRARRTADPTARDGITVGVVTVVLGVALLVTPARYALDYAIAGAGSFTLTGITIAVGLFGGYAAVVAVFLAIAGFSPRRAETAPAAPAEEAAS